MKNANKWGPSRAIWSTRRGAWVLNDAEVNPSSRFAATVQLRAYVAAILEYAHGDLLDCGCGQVPYFGIYRDQVSSIQCLDWPGSPHEIVHADQLRDLGEGLPYSDSTFDTVMLTDVLEHIAEPAQLIREIARVLRPGGRMLCFVPFLYGVHEAPHDFYRYTRYALEMLSAQAGLTVESLRPYGGGPDVVVDTLVKTLSQRPRLVHRITLVANRMAVRARYVRLRSRTEERLPLGYILVARQGAPGSPHAVAQTSDMLPL